MVGVFCWTDRVSGMVVSFSPATLWNRFGVEGLVEAGFSYKDPPIKKACDFLLSKQKADGG